jgi:hypothetical protein
MASNSKKPINSGVKGKRGERQVRDLLIQYGYTARRGRQFSGSPDSPDVVSSFDEIHIESKWVESLNIYKAFEQSEKDAGSKIPTVWHRKSRTPWMVTLRAEDFLRLANRSKEQKQPESILPALMGVYRLVQ